MSVQSYRLRSVGVLLRRCPRLRKCRIGLIACGKATPAKLRFMKRVVLSFVMWLLVLALPVQGFAASTMLLCGAGHHGTVQVSEGHDHARHIQMGAHDVSGVAESATHDIAAEASRSNEDPAPSPSAAKQAKVAGKCSACAACCSVAFLPTNVIAFTAPAPSRVLPVVELTSHVGFFTDGPDRPPRLLLA